MSFKMGDGLPDGGETDFPTRVPKGTIEMQERNKRIFDEIKEEILDPQRTRELIITYDRGRRSPYDLIIKIGFDPNEMTPINLSNTLKLVREKVDRGHILFKSTFSSAINDAVGDIKVPGLLIDDICKKYQMTDRSTRDILGIAQEFSNNEKRVSGEYMPHGFYFKQAVNETINTSMPIDEILKRYQPKEGKH